MSTVHRRIAFALVSLAIATLARPMRAQAANADWPALGRYRQANAELGPPRAGEPRVVFMGNSITELWAPLFASQFPGKPYVGRGISGQTTPQMLLRFRQDVIALQPKVVVILGGPTLASLVIGINLLTEGISRILGRTVAQRN